MKRCTAESTRPPCSISMMFIEPPLVEPVDGGQALGDELAVAAVAAEDVVLGASAKAAPTAAPSWPMERWAGPAWI